MNKYNLIYYGPVDLNNKAVLEKQDVMEEARTQQIDEMYAILKWPRTFTNIDHILVPKGLSTNFKELMKSSYCVPYISFHS